MITIALYNLKGGVGKTTTAVNLAYLAAEAKKPTVLWDWDAQGAASWYFGSDNTSAKKAVKLLNKGVEIAKFEMHSPFDGLTYIPADLSLRNIDTELAGKTGVRQLLKKIIQPLSKDTSFLIFDCPPQLSSGMEHILANVDVVLVPMIPSPMSTRAVEQMVEFFGSKKGAPDNIMGFFNMVDLRRNLHKDTIKAARKLPISVLKSFIPMDAAAESASARRAPLASYAHYGRAAIAYRKMWREVLRKVNAKK